MLEYDMNHSQRGLAFIIANTHKREGNEFDVGRLTKTLTSFNFTIKYYIDLSWDQIKDEIEQLDHDYSHDDCLLVVILTHGRNGHLSSSNGTLYTLDDVCKCFSPRCCPQLKGKPKLFFVNACDGPRKDTSSDTKDGAIFMGAPWLNLKYSDLLIMFSTVQGYVSVREEENGSWFITELCNILDTHLHNSENDILMLLTDVNHNMAINYGEQGMKQMPFFISMLTRILRLKPKSKSLGQQIKRIKLEHSS